MTDPPKKRGRPRKTAQTRAATPTTAPASTAPTSTAPASTAPSSTASLDSFPVGQVTAHRPVTLLEVQDSADLDVLLLDGKVGAHVLTRLSPTFALLAPGSEKAVLDALRKAGHTPRVQEYAARGEGT